MSNSGLRKGMHAPFFHSLAPQHLTGVQLDRLLALGWYRMHQHVFTTSHVQLDSLYPVHWLRYDLTDFVPQSTHRRMMRKASAFTHTVGNVEIDEQQTELHKRYRSFISFEGPITITDCLFGDQEVQPSIFTTKMIRIFDRDALIACGYFDLGKQSAASILHFFDPQYRRYSPGKLLILYTIEYLQQQGYVNYYPGYVVEGNPKMDYKLFLDKHRAQYFEPVTGEWKRWIDK